MSSGLAILVFFFLFEGQAVALQVVGGMFIPEQWKTDLYPPSRDVQSFLNNEIQVQVYVDPTNNNPAVISTTMGLLRVMAGSGAVQKLDKSQ